MIGKLKILFYISLASFIIALVVSVDVDALLIDVYVPCVSVLLGVAIGGVGIFLGLGVNVYTEVNKLRTRKNKDRIGQYLVALDGSIAEIKSNLVWSITLSVGIVFLYLLYHTKLDWIWSMEDDSFLLSILKRIRMEGVDFPQKFFLFFGTMFFLMIFCAIQDTVKAMFSIHEQCKLILLNNNNNSQQKTGGKS